VHNDRGIVVVTLLFLNRAGRIPLQVESFVAIVSHPARQDREMRFVEQADVNSSIRSQILEYVVDGSVTIVT